MKKALLFTCILATSLTHGQKILNSVVDKEFNESGGIDYVDSTVYNYVSGNHYLNELKPKFGYDGDILYYFMEDLFIHCDSMHQYNGSSYPLSLTNVTGNTLTNGLVTTSEFGGGNNRRIYEYDNQGRRTSKVTQSFNGTVWTSIDSSSYIYDASGNVIVDANYGFNGATMVASYLDSLWYQTGTSNLTKASSYYNNGTSLDLDFQTVVTYTGTEISFLDLFESDGNGGLDWYFRLDYLYNGGELTGFDAYEVTNNTPSTTADAEGYFTYTTQNEIESYTLIFDGDTLGKIVYNYDAEGFIDQVDNYEEGTASIYLAWIEHYYYTNVASVEEIENITVSIFPNPTTQVINIQSDELIEKVQIFDILGNILLEQNNTNQVEVSHLPNGSYIIRGNSKDGMFNKMFVKQ